MCKKLSSNDIPKDSKSSSFWAELAISYSENGHSAALLNHTIQHYECASYCYEIDYEVVKARLHLGDVITIQEEGFKESYALIHSIFRHKSNDNNYFAFIVVNWFEDTGQVHELLECPLFRIQTNSRQRWRRVFPITVIYTVGKEHFIHNCSSRCSIKLHDFGNNLYFRNTFLFTAI